MSPTQRLEQAFLVGFGDGVIARDLLDASRPKLLEQHLYGHLELSGETCNVGACHLYPSLTRAQWNRPQACSLSNQCARARIISSRALVINAGCLDQFVDRKLGEFVARVHPCIGQTRRQRAIHALKRQQVFGR